MVATSILGLVAGLCALTMAQAPIACPKVPPNQAVGRDGEGNFDWCGSQTSTCSILCDGITLYNSCDPTTFCYSCICGSNSSVPGLYYYQNTIPTLICEREYSNCIQSASEQADPDEIEASQDKCAATERASCGHLDPSALLGADTSSTVLSISSASTTPVVATATATVTAPPVVVTTTATSTSTPASYSTQSSSYSDESAPLSCCENPNYTVVRNPNSTSSLNASIAEMTPLSSTTSVPATSTSLKNASSSSVSSATSTTFNPVATTVSGASRTSAGAAAIGILCLVLSGF